MRSTHAADLRRHLGVGRDGVGEDRNELEAVVLDLAVADIEIEPRDELAMAAGGDQQRLADLDDVRQRIVGMRGQDDVDALDARGQLAVDVEAVVRQQHDQRRAVLARLVDIDLDIVLANAEGPIRDHPARIGDRRIGQRLSDHGDAHAAALDHRHGIEGGLVPLGVADVLREERKAELADQLLDPIGAEGELPVPDHGVRLQQRHAVDHVLTLADQGRVAVLPGIAAVEEHHPLAALGADRLEDRGDAVEPAQLAVGLGQ